MTPPVFLSIGLLQHDDAILNLPPLFEKLLVSAIVRMIGLMILSNILTKTLVKLTGLKSDENSLNLILLTGVIVASFHSTCNLLSDMNIVANGVVMFTAISLEILRSSSFDPSDFFVPKDLSPFSASSWLFGLAT